METGNSRLILWLQEKSIIILQTTQSHHHQLVGQHQTTRLQYHEIQARQQICQRYHQAGLPRKYRHFQLWQTTCIKKPDTPVGRRWYFPVGARRNGRRKTIFRKKTVSLFTHA
jgi:hypothetical protein